MAIFFFIHLIASVNVYITQGTWKKNLCLKMNFIEKYFCLLILSYVENMNKGKPIRQNDVTPSVTFPSRAGLFRWGQNVGVSAMKCHTVGD